MRLLLSRLRTGVAVVRSAQKLREAEFKGGKVVGLGTQVRNTGGRTESSRVLFRGDEQSWLLEALGYTEFEENIPTFLAFTEDADNDVRPAHRLHHNHRQGSPGQIQLVRCKSIDSLLLQQATDYGSVGGRGSGYECSPFAPPPGFGRSSRSFRSRIRAAHVLPPRSSSGFDWRDGSLRPGARQGEGRLLGTELDVTQPVFQAAHLRRFGASAKVAFDALADGLDLRHFQPGDLGNHLPDGSVIGTLAIVEKMLDSAHQLLNFPFVDAGSAARCLGVALMVRGGEL